MIIKLLSTVRRVTFENADGVVLASIVRQGDARKGKEMLVGTVPAGPHFRAVHYWDGTVDRSMHSPQTTAVKP